MLAEIEMFTYTYLHIPSNVPLLVADVFIVVGVLHDLRNIHN